MGDTLGQGRGGRCEFYKGSGEGGASRDTEQQVHVDKERAGSSSVTGVEVTEKKGDHGSGECNAREEEKSSWSLRA